MCPTYNLFLLLILLFIFENLLTVICDCGLPAIPVHTKVRPFTHIYYEDESVEYYCEYDDMILIGNDRRKCSQSKWKGDIPHCVREIPRRSLERIEMVDLKNHTITKTYISRNMLYNVNYFRDLQRYQMMTFYGNSEQSSNECINSKIKSNVTSIEWRVIFKWTVSQVFYVQIVVFNQNIDNRIDLNKTDSVIKSVYVSQYRECVPQPVETVDISHKLYKYTFFCELKYKNININPEVLNGLRSETITNITINFALNQLTVCEVHISETIPFRSYTSGSCGSPDIPLFANYSPVFDTVSGSPFPIGYSFTCDQGFYLEGNSTVICGVNNKWMDSFPTCLPNKSCILTNSTRLKELNLQVNYENLFSFDGNVSAINATQAIFSCPKPDKNQIDSWNKTIIGDSIRFCQIDGNWSGEEPVCLDKNDFTLYMAELNEDILKGESFLPKFAEHQHRVDECHMPAIPKYAKVYAYDPDLLNIYMANIKERIDLMPKYPNGSVITYNCDSKFTYMASDFESRTCVNGSWIGPIGKCYIPVGGTDVTRAISLQVQYQKGSDPPHQFLHQSLPFNTSDRYWNYYERDNNKCLTLKLINGSQLTLNVFLSVPTRVSYFLIRLGARNIFHELEDMMFKVKRASQLERSSPITADIDVYYRQQKSECEVTKIIETGSFDKFQDGLTLVSFKCLEPHSEQINTNKRKQLMRMYPGQYEEMKTSAINIHINPEQFHENFNSTDIKFCGIMFFQSSEDCGVPENVPNSEVISNPGSGYVRYGCKRGHKLVGNEYVRCSRFGDWMDQFPRCELYKLCDIKRDNSTTTQSLQRKYYNTLVIDNEEVAVLGSIVKYKCIAENIYQGVHIMIGPRTAVCTQNGQWSVEEPICADDKYFIKSSLDGEDHRRGPNVFIIPMVIFLSILSIIIVISLVLVYRHYGWSNPLVSIISRRRPTRNSSTFISYGQSNLRDSVMSFNDEINSSANNHSIA